MSARLSGRRRPAALLLGAVATVSLALVPGAGAHPSAGSTAMTVAGSVTDPPLPPFVLPPSTAPDFEMVLSNDFLNDDIGDARRSPRWRPGDPNSTNPQVEASLDTVLASFASVFDDSGATTDPASPTPRYVAVAGDLVQGHWGMDSDDTGIFGAVSTDRQRLRAVRRAGALYYSSWMERFAEHGLVPLPGIGDHELGDNPWNPGDVKASRAGYIRFKQRTIPRWKQVFGTYTQRGTGGQFVHPDRPSGPAHHTAYATRLTPDVQFVSLDAFKQTRRSVVPQLDRPQMQWLQRVLADARADGVGWTIVQLHPYIAGPVRQRGTSGLRYRGGTGSRLWSILDRYGVDLVSVGEVHQLTATQPRAGGPLQIANGGVFSPGWTSYLDLEFRGETLAVTAYAFDVRVDHSQKIWQTDRGKTAGTPIFGAPYPVGSLTLTTDGVVTERSGMLGPYTG